jgi:L-alanine-DL-glutamate epimerase-like enolase superfamily enzyme
MRRRTFVIVAAACSAAAARLARAADPRGDARLDRCGPLRIESVKITVGDGPCEVRLSSGAIPRYAFGLVRIRAAGVEGVGEGHVKDIGHLAAAVRGLVGADARRLDHLLPAGAAMPVGEAVSIALHDLVAKAVGVPFHVLLGGAARPRVPLVPCIFAAEPRAAAERAAEFAKRGFSAVKFKLFGKPELDLAVLEAVRGATPAGRTVQADANFGYRDLATVRGLLPRLAAAGLDIVEDPLESAPADPYRDYAALRGLTRVRIMLDIGVRPEAGLAEAIRRGSGDLVNLHPNQQGSVSRAVRRAAVAETSGLPVFMGGTGSFGVQAAAWQQLAAVVASDLPCGEIGGAFDHGFPDDIVVAPYPLTGGAVELPDAPGLGIAIDEDAVGRMASAEETFDRPV